MEGINARVFELLAGLSTLAGCVASPPQSLFACPAGLRLIWLANQSDCPPVSGESCMTDSCDLGECTFFNKPLSVRHVTCSTVNPPMFLCDPRCEECQAGMCVGTQLVITEIEPNPMSVVDGGNCGTGPSPNVETLFITTCGPKPLPVTVRVTTENCPPGWSCGGDVPVFLISNPIQITWGCCSNGVSVPQTFDHQVSIVDGNGDVTDPVPWTFVCEAQPGASSAVGSQNSSEGSTRGNETSGTFIWR